jgi:CRP/FNR family transcriptional regulator, cyclic AMP receptor protein
MDNDLLGGLSTDERRLVAAKMNRRAFKKGDTLFFEGDLGDSLHIVQKGRVAVRTSTPQGDVATLTVLGPGACFGEQALLSEDARRTASVVALEAVETRLLHRRDFDELLRHQPTVERLLVDVLAAQVRRLTSQVLDALYVPAERRVIRRAAELADLYDEGVRPIDIPIRQEDLASMAGTTRPTANRVLKQLEDDGVITLGRGRMSVVDAAVLRKRAG